MDRAATAHGLRWRHRRCLRVLSKYLTEKISSYMALFYEKTKKTPHLRT